MTNEQSSHDAKAAKQYKDISANIGKPYDNLCQLIMDNGTMNPEQVLKVVVHHDTVLFIKPFQQQFSYEIYDGFRWEKLRVLNSFPVILLEDLTPQPSPQRNPQGRCPMCPKDINLIETVEDLYERVKEAVDKDKDLSVSVLFTCGAMINYQLVVNDGLSSSPKLRTIVEVEAALRYGLKVEVVE